LIEALVAEQTEHMQRKNLTLSFEAETHLPAVLANSVELKRAIRHLLTNAANHTPSGGAINLRTYHTEKYISVEVRDTGVGIDQQHLPNIFHLFYKADSSRSLELGGVGVGLSIVQMIAEAHGGMVTVSSTPGEGSIFTLLLPISRQEDRQLAC
jgi:signal transduction histidine kinase